MRKCKELTQLLSERMERPLTLREKIAVFLHTHICSNCHQFDKNTKNLHQLIQTYRQGQIRKK